MSHSWLIFWTKKVPTREIQLYYFYTVQSQMSHSHRQSGHSSLDNYVHKTWGADKNNQSTEE